MKVKLLVYVMALIATLTTGFGYGQCYTGIPLDEVSENEMESLKWMREEIKDGIDVRYYPVDELRMNVNDKSQSTLTIVNPKDSKDRITMFFEHSGFSELLTKYFDELWGKAEIIK